MGRTVVSSVAVAALLLTLIAPTAAHADDSLFSVSGHVTTGSSDAIVDVSLFDSDGNDVADTADGDVSASGDYTITDVPPGSYTAMFSDESGTFLTRYYGDVVTDDQTTTGVRYFDITDADVAGIDGTLALVPFAETSAPRITGAHKLGRTLSVYTGDWVEDPDFEYQWLRGTKAIPDAADDSYDITAADLGQSISVRVTATEAGYTDLSRSSAAVTIPLGGVFGARPSITGVAKIGGTLRAVPGAWKPSRVHFTYRWMLGKKLIPKATRARLHVKAAYAGKKIRVVVIGSTPGVGAAMKVSRAVKVAAR